MEKKTNMILKTGIVGSIVAAICCFTPLLVILLGVLGLGAVTGYLDYVLLPTLGIFLIIMAYGGYLEKKAGYKTCASTTKEGSKNERY